MISANLLYLVFAYFLLLIQSHFFLPFGTSGIRPDLLLIFIVYAGIHWTYLRCGFFCLVAGYLAELLSGANSGLFMLVFLCSCCCIKLLKKYFNFATMYEFCFLVLCCLLIKFLLLFLSFAFIYEHAAGTVTPVLIKESVFTLVLFPVVFFLLDSVQRFLNS